MRSEIKRFHLKIVAGLVISAKVAIIVGTIFSVFSLVRFMENHKYVSGSQRRETGLASQSAVKFRRFTVLLGFNT